MGMITEDNVLLLGGQMIHLSTPLDAKTLYVIMKAFSEYIWRCQLYGNNPSVVIALSILFAVMFGYRSVIESMLGARVGGENEPQKGSPEESYLFRARQVAQGRLPELAENNLFTPPLILLHFTLFTLAVTNNINGIALLILELKGISTSLEEKSTWGSISGASREGHTPLVALWLSEDPSNHGPVFLMAIYEGHLEIVNLFLEEDSLRNIISQKEVCSCWCHNPLIYTTAEGHLNIVNRLLEAGADADPQHIDTSCPQCVEEMGGHRSSKTNTNSCTPLEFAAHFGNLPILNRLLEMGACVSKETGSCWKRCSPLSHAAEQGHLHILDRLLELDKELHSLVYSLERAIKRRQVPAVEILLEVVTRAKCTTSGTRKIGVTSLF
ncbi:ankyrin [Morchella conica CCBAS932]|uniref:Ankyrin n=1 Tax=Morchella conica CCBAS932 TaxID=1392247 RepID=A0A3N4KQ41_9PEZI|nr:ankyrin [Morchella conica CCBAS932]